VLHYILLETVILFFMIHRLIESSEEQILKQKSTVTLQITYDLFNAALINTIHNDTCFLRSKLLLL